MNLRIALAQFDFPVGAVEMLPADPEKTLVKIKYIKSKPESQLSQRAAIAPVK